MRTDLRVKHDVEARKAVIELFERGHGFKSAAKELSVPRDTVRQWLCIYRLFGSEVLLTMDGKQARCTYEQKVAAASAVVDGGMAKPTAMAERGAVIADKTVLKTMREMGIRCGIRRETGYHRYNSYKGVVGETFENVVGRDFAADGPWQKMGVDVTEFKQS